MERPKKRQGFSDSLRYVDDFVTELVEDDKGRTRKKTTYIGTWQVLREPGAKTLWMLIGAAAMSLASAGCVMTALLLPHAGAGDYPVMVPHLISLFPFLYQLMGAASLPYRQKPMRRDQYMHGFIRMQRSAVAILAMTAVGMLAAPVLRLIRSDWLFLKGDVFYFVLTAAALLFEGGVLWILGRIETAERPNGFYKPEAM